MRSMIAKLAILLALPLTILAGCSGSLEGEVRSALRAERDNAVRFQKVATAYVRSCVETVRKIAGDEIEGNPFALIQILQYCSRLADSNGDKLSNAQQSAILGCVQPILQNNGLPQTDEQEAAVVAECSDTASSVLGLKKEEKKAEAASGPTGEASSAPSEAGN